MCSVHLYLEFGVPRKSGTKGLARGRLRKLLFDGFFIDPVRQVSVPEAAYDLLR